MGKKEEVPALNFGYQRKPFCCPACNGKGKVQQGFYDMGPMGWRSGTVSTTDSTPENCRSCGGSGIVWG